jgi:hypothetical protein
MWAPISVTANRVHLAVTGPRGEKRSASTAASSAWTTSNLIAARSCCASPTNPVCGPAVDPRQQGPREGASLYPRTRMQSSWCTLRGVLHLANLEIAHTDAAPMQPVNSARARVRPAIGDHRVSEPLACAIAFVKSPAPEPTRGLPQSGSPGADQSRDRVRPEPSARRRARRRTPAPTNRQTIDRAPNHRPRPCPPRACMRRRRRRLVRSLIRIG